MKKILSISILAALAISPMMAMADKTLAELTDESKPVAADQGEPDMTGVPNPMFAIEEFATGDDTTAASASYVKGAYNAAIRAVNKVSQQAGSDTTALKKGIVSTINHSSVDMYTQWGETTKGTAAVKAPGQNNNQYYPTYNATAESLTPGQNETWYVSEAQAPANP